MFVPMLSEDVAVGFDVGRAFVGETLFDIGPRQVYDDDISVHRLERLHAEIAQADLVFEVEVGGFARPTPGVSLQRLFGGAGQIRTCDVRQSGGSGMPFGKENAERKGDLG